MHHLQFVCLSLVLLIPVGRIGAEPAAQQEASAAQISAAPITTEDVRPHIEFLASPKLRGRSGSEAAIAAEYIKDHFARFDLQPLFAEESFFQEIPGGRLNGMPPSILGRNVGAWIPGSDPKLRQEFVIVGAHYDHLGVRNGEIYAGADDNASGVSLMLEVARIVGSMEKKPRRSLVFVGFDLEEHMLWGSRWFAARPPWPLEQVKLFVTADMVGRSLRNLPLPTVFILGSEHASQLRSVLDEVTPPQGLETARLGIDLIGTRSDYGPFRDEKIPFLFFSTGEHPDYHTPRDVPERIDYAKVANVSSLVLQICTRVANAEVAPVWQNKPEPTLDEVRALHRISTLLLEQDGLSNAQRFVVSQAHTSSKLILERGKITAPERQWLVRLSQVLLLAVF